MNLFKIFGTIAVNNSTANTAIDDTADRANSASGIMQSAFKKIGAAVVTYLAVDKIKAFGQAIVQASAEVSAEQSAFEQIMGDYASQAQEKLNSVADATGVMASRLTPYMTSITAKFKGLGYDIDDATSLAQRGLTLASDAAAFWDKSLDDSMGALNSFINGSYEGGEAIGLFANDTQLASYAVKQGIVSEAKEWSNLDEARKQATRLQYAEDMYKLSGATGQAAKEADQYANVQANLTEKWRQFKAQLGEPVLQNIVIPAMDKLSGVVDFASQKFKEAQPFIESFGNKISAAKDVASELGAYASETFSPVIEGIGDAFDRGKEMIQPFIDVLGEYFDSGEAAADITNILKDAIDLAAGVATGLVDGVNGIAQGFMDMYTWGQQNVPIVSALGVVFAGLTAAVLAHNASRIAKQALDVIETVQIYALIAAENAHTVATGIATAATTAFGTAVAFLTSPITIVIAIITALIAVGVLLYQNWDTVKEKCGELKEWLNQKWEEINQGISNAVTGALSKVSETFEGIRSTVSEKAEAARRLASEKFEGIRSAIAEKTEAARSTVFNLYAQIKETISTKIGEARGIALGIFDSIKEGIREKIEGAREAVGQAIEKIKGFFNFSWSLPKLKLPHISISGSFSINPPSAPHFGISWYKKAMDSPMLLDEATIFGYNPSSGRFLGGGEDGDEVVAGTNTLMNMIREASSENNGAVVEVIEDMFNKLFRILETYFPQFTREMVLDTGQLVAATADQMDGALGIIKQRKDRE